MLEEESRREIQDFVKEKATISGASTEDPQDGYFRAVIGRHSGRGKSPFRGIYLSKHSTNESLTEAVLRHTRRSWKAAEKERGARDRLFLNFYIVGQNNPDDGIEVDVLEDDHRHHADAADQIRRASSTGGSFEGAAAVAMLETNQMLRGLLTRVLEDFRHALEQKTHTEGLVTELMAKVNTAEAMVEVMAHETEIRKVDRFFERMDPHVDKFGPNLVEALGYLAQGWSWKLSGGNADPCPPEPGPAADWLIQRFAMSMNALGMHLDQHPEVLTSDRRKKLEQLIETLLTVATHLEDEA